MSDDIEKAAWRLCLHIDYRLGKIPAEHSSIWTPELLRAAKEQALQHHEAHIAKMRVDQRRLDPFKFLSWYGFILVRQAWDAPRSRYYPLALTIDLMNDLLGRSCSDGTGMDRLGMSIDCVRELRRLAERDGVDDDFAIGKNGLYSAFRSAFEIKKQFTQRVYDGSVVIR